MIKKYLIIIGVVLITGISCFLYGKYKHQVTAPITTSIPYQRPVYIKDSNGVTHAQFQSVSLQRDSYKHQLDSIKNLRGIKPKDVTSVSDVVDSVIIHTGGDTVVVHDTVYSFTKKNNWLSLEGTVSPHKWGLSLSLTDTLHTITYDKKSLFGPNETFVDISNSNPYVRITSGRSVTIKETKPFIVIGPYIGYEVYPKEHLSIGISITHPLITIP